MRNDAPVYLARNIKMEPLVDRWYAWPHLIPPLTFARNLTERHLKILDSYIRAPQVHAAAVRNPKMAGGPFVDYDGGRVDAIRELRDETKTRRSDLIALSAALSELDNMLRIQATGMSLQPLYAKVPDVLKGYVELVYDLNNNPSFRIFEPLLYRSRYYDPGMQSLMFSTIDNDDRPFVLSTPRLDSPEAVHLRMPFRDEAIDFLARMKTSAQPIGDVLDFVAPPERNAFSRFFTPQAPAPYAPYKGAGIRWRYFGHACILVETDRVAILSDPVLSYTYESDISRYTYQDLPDRIDYVLISHIHPDHVLLETLLQIRHKIGTIVVPRGGAGCLQDPSLKFIVENIGFFNVVELDVLGSVGGEGITITGLPFMGEHADLDVRSKLAYLVRTGKHSMVFAADSCNVEPALYDLLAGEIAPVDVLFIGMECDGAPLTWLYGPLLTKPIERAADQSRRLSGSDCNQAFQIAEKMNCREVYVYAMGQEPWLNYVMSIKYDQTSRPIVESDHLIERCAARGIVAERLFGEKETLIDP